MEEIGCYVDSSTGKMYKVERHTKGIPHRPLAGVNTVLDGSCEYKTSCGLDLQELDEDLSSFEFIQIDGVITRVEPA